MANVNLDLLNACITTVAATLRDNEAIIQIRQGKIIFSRNAQIPFLIDIATVDNGETTTNPRGVIAYVTSNTPHQVQLQDTFEKFQWVPLL